MPFKEWRLPGSYDVEGYTGKRALLKHNTHRQDPASELALLDLETGKVNTLLGRPIEHRAGLQFLGYELSDAVVAWEECSPYDLDNPSRTSWRLYASRYADGKLLGPPVLLDHSDRGLKVRPLFAVTGKTVVWLTGAQLVSDDGRAKRARMSVYAHDVAGGSRLEILSTDAPLWTLAVDGERLTVAERDSKAGRVVVQAGRWASCPWKPVVTTLPVAVPSHVPRERGGLTVFAAVTAQDAGEADLFMRFADGRILRMADRANNPVFAGDFVFWSATENRRLSQYGAIHASRAGTTKEFTLVSDDVSENWWRTSVGQTYLPHTFVIWSDRYGLGDGGRDETLVRVYRL